MKRFLTLMALGLLMGQLQARDNSYSMRIGSGTAGDPFASSGIAYQRWSVAELSGSSMLRVGVLITDLYKDGWNAAPDFSEGDAKMLRSYQFGAMEPVFLLNWDSTRDDTATVPIDNVWMGEDKWYNAGVALANRYRPNSDWWLNQGIEDFGARYYCAKNEPAHVWTDQNVETPERFALFVEAFADGVHSIDWELRPTTGGLWGGYWKYYEAVVPLLNDGTIYGMHNHPYGSDKSQYTPIYKSKPQDLYDAWIDRGVKDGLPIFFDEAGYSAYSEDGTTIPAHRNAPKQLSFLLGCFGIVDGLGLPATEFVMPWCIVQNDGEDPTWGLWSVNGYNPIEFNEKGKVVQMIAQHLSGMDVLSSDTRHEGTMKLSGNGKTAWVFHNRDFWTHTIKSSMELVDIPIDATQLQVAYWDSWQQNPGTTGHLAPATTLNISGHNGSRTISNLRQQETVIVIANAETPLGTFEMETAIATTGRCDYADGTYLITGSGADIWSQSDEFNYAFNEVKDDCVITAKITSLTNTDPWAKAGLMIRSGTGANAKFAAAFVRPDKQAVFQSRSTTGGNAVTSGLTGGTNDWKWLRLRRSGNTVTAWYSIDGSTWAQIGNPLNIDLGERIIMGLAVTSHNRSADATATFSQVTAADIFRLRNRWRDHEFLTDGGSNVAYGSGTDDSYYWYKVKTDYPDYYALVNLLTNDFMHIQHNNDYIECSDYIPGRENWANSRWKMPRVDRNDVNIISAYTGDGLTHRIHVEDQTIDAPKHKTWSGLSSHWQIVD